MADLTTVQVYANNISNISQVVSTTVLSQSSGTINLASINLSNTAPADIARTASAGSSDVAARADHVHNAANLLMDGGNY